MLMSLNSKGSNSVIISEHSITKIMCIFFRFWAIWRAHCQCQLGCSSGAFSQLFSIHIVFVAVGNK